MNSSEFKPLIADTGRATRCPLRSDPNTSPGGVSRTVRPSSSSVRQRQECSRHARRAFRRFPVTWTSDRHAPALTAYPVSPRRCFLAFLAELIHASGNLPRKASQSRVATSVAFLCHLRGLPAPLLPALRYMRLTSARFCSHLRLPDPQIRSGLKL